MNPKVAVLVLNWNGKDIAQACLDSLKELTYQNYETLDFDHGSEDGSEAEIKEHYPWAKVLQNGENLGYAEGNNRGIKWALEHKADYIFLVNNDTIIHKNCVSWLVETAEKNSLFGILAPIAYEYGSWEKPISSGLNMDLSSKWVWPYQWGNSEKMLAEEKNVYPFDLVQGDAFFVRRSVFEKVGFFDPRFFLLHEEFDFCMRAKKFGYEVGIVRDARYQRMNSATLGKYKYHHAYYATRNFLLFLLKNAGFKNKKEVLIHYLKRVKWDFKDRILKEAMVNGQWNHLISFVESLFPMLHGCLDFFMSKYGRFRVLS